MMTSRCCKSDVVASLDEKGGMLFVCVGCGENCEADTDLKFLPESRHSAPVRIPRLSGSPGDARKGG
jgi:hypothetical protein